MILHLLQKLVELKLNALKRELVHQAPFLHFKNV